MKKKYLTTLIMSFLIVGILSGCGHTHTWTEATCTQPKTCSECGKTEGEVTEHTWVDATCVQPKTCSECGKAEGEVTEHTWVDATCIQPKTCSECGKTEGEVLEHMWIEATCMAPKTCSDCGQTEGTSLEHRLNHNTGKCYECEEQIATMIERYDLLDFFNASHTSFEWSPCTYTYEPKESGYSYVGNVMYTVNIIDKFTGKVAGTSAILVELDENGYGSGSIEFNDSRYKIELYDVPKSFVCYY